MLSFALVVLAVSASPKPAPPLALPPEAQLLKTLHAEHPRLMARAEDFERLKALVKENPQAGAILRSLRREAEKLLTARPIEHRLIGPRLLDMSRRCLERVYTLGLVYRLEGDRRFAERAIREMLAAAAFPDWNPKHFLDTAEMTHALAVGYDWLYDALGPVDRGTIRDAIVDKGLREGERAYRSNKGWFKAEHNWNQVCNGGIAVGALAVAEDQPQLSAFLVHQAVECVPRAMKEYAPDGGWAEGPGYWGYATNYNVYFLAGLESALGTDFGLSHIPGFSLTGDFRLHSVGPTKLCFNFADAVEWAGHTPAMYWLARKFDRPIYAWHEREFLSGSTALDLLWYDGRPASIDDVPADRWFRHVDVAFLRSKWNDPRALYVGFKGGDNGIGHAHLQLGTFVLDALGQRWVLDLGPDDYNLPGYFGSRRWTYYRLSTRGQNTLLIDGKNQDPKAVARITAFRSSPRRSFAVVDLTAAYPGQARQMTRGIAMLDRRQILVQDELIGVSGNKVTWQVHTKARIELHGPLAALKLGGETLLAKILAPPGAQFTAEPASAPSPQHQQPDVQRLTIKVSPTSPPLQIAVLFVPGQAAAAAPPPLVPLQQWSAGR